MLAGLIVFVLIFSSSGLYSDEKLDTGQYAAGVVIWTIENKSGMTQSDAETVSALVTAEVGKVSGKRTFSEKDLDTLLSGVEKQLECNASNTACIAEIGAALGAPEAVSGIIAKMGDYYILTLNRINVRTSEVESRVSKKVKINMNSLIESIGPAVAELYGINKDDTAKGSKTVSTGKIIAVKFESGTQNSKAYLDDRLFCFSLPCEKDVEEGEHTIMITAQGYVPFVKKVEIFKNEVFTATLKKDESFLTITNADLVGEMTVKLNGEKIDKLPIKNMKLRSGKHVLNIESECYESFNAIIDIPPEETKEMHIGIIPQKAVLSVNLFDSSGNKMESGDIIIDDRKTGTAPGTFTVPLCSQTMIVRQHGYIDFLAPLSLNQNETFSIAATMEYSYKKVRPYKWWGLGLFIGGVALIGGGVAFDVLADMEYDEYRKMSTTEALKKAMLDPAFSRESYDKKMKSVKERGEQYDILRIVGYSAGGAFALTGIILMVVPKKVKVLDMVSVAPYNDGVMLTFGHDF